jgi:hypothetical protein
MTADDQVGHIWRLLHQTMNGGSIEPVIQGGRFVQCRCREYVGCRESRCLCPRSVLRLSSLESQRSAEASRFLCRDLASARCKTPCQLHQHTISIKHPKERFICISLTPSNLGNVIINSPLCEGKIVSHISTILLHEHVAIQGPRTHHRHVVYSRVP